MTIRIGESGKKIRVACGVDLSDFTSLLLRFEVPVTGANVDRTDLTGVSAPAVELTSTPLGTLSASTYMEYTFNANDFTTVGTWNVTPKFTNTAASPVQIFIGETTTFEVLAGLPS